MLPWEGTDPYLSGWQAGSCPEFGDLDVTSTVRLRADKSCFVDSARVRILCYRWVGSSQLYTLSLLHELLLQMDSMVGGCNMILRVSKGGKSLEDTEYRRQTYPHTQTTLSGTAHAVMTGMVLVKDRGG